jgi:hypothetical protein
MRVREKGVNVMETQERRAGRDRRSSDRLNRMAPFLTKDGLILADRRRGDRDRRQVNMAELFALSIELGDVEEIVLEPVRFG